MVEHLSRCARFQGIISKDMQVSKWVQRILIIRVFRTLLKWSMVCLVTHFRYTSREKLAIP